MVVEKLKDNAHQSSDCFLSFIFLSFIFLDGEVVPCGGGEIKRQRSSGPRLLFLSFIFFSFYLLSFIFLDGAREGNLSPAVVEKLKDSAHQGPSWCPSSPHLTFKHGPSFMDICQLWLGEPPKKDQSLKFSIYSKLGHWICVVHFFKFAKYHVAPSHPVRLDRCIGICVYLWYLYFSKVFVFLSWLLGPWPGTGGVIPCISISSPLYWANNPHISCNKRPPTTPASNKEKCIDHHHILLIPPKKFNFSNTSKQLLFFLKAS